MGISSSSRTRSSVISKQVICCVFPAPRAPAPILHVQIRSLANRRRNAVAGGAASNKEPKAKSGSKSPIPPKVLRKKNPAIESQVMLANKWDENKVDPTGYIMSEKLDGMRAAWDGEALYSRVGNPIYAPSYFVDALPRGVRLDGELFIGRGRFADVMSTCRSHAAPESEWQQVRYAVFDCPSTSGGIAERLEAAKKALGESSSHVAYVHPYVTCTGADHVFKELSRLLALDPPAEGLMLAAPGKAHRGLRCNDILKVKKYHTDDAKVIGYKDGKGRHVGRLGALECQLRNGYRFDVGSGFSDADRDVHKVSYPLGCIIEFRYFEITEAGVPRFPTYVRKRPDIDPSEFS